MKNRVRALHVLGEILPSGGETMLASAAGIFSAHGISNTALSTGRTVGSFAPDLQASGFEIAHLPFSKSPGHFHAVGELIRKYHFDVVHVHCERAFFYYILAAKVVGCRRIIRTVHHIFPWSGWLRVRAILQRHVASRILGATFVSNSRSGQDNEKRCYFMSNVLIPNWYDSRKFTPRTFAQYQQARKVLGIVPGVFIILSVGGNSSYKNYNLVIEAVARLPQEVPVLYLQVGNEGEERPLSSLVNRLGVSSRVRCCGRVADTLPYLQAADAYVMPSSIEGFGVAAAEAMACGVPAVLSTRPALRDFSAASDKILWVDCAAESITEKCLNLFAEQPNARWDRGQELARAMPGYCGLDVGPLLFSKLYREHKGAVQK